MLQNQMKKDEELQASGFYAELFSKSSQGGLFGGKQTVEVIDVNKLAETGFTLTKHHHAGCARFRNNHRERSYPIN